MKARVAFGFLVVLLFWYSHPSFAAVVNVPTDQPTIQAGIDVALSGDTVLVSDGTYKGAGNKNLDFKGKAITVQSENGAANCIIDCESDGIGFYFHNGEGTHSVLSGLTITNSKAYNGGGIYCNNASPSIQSCIVRGNSSTGFGGGICCVNSFPTISDCKIVQNSADIHGGGIYCQNSTATITNCTISGNTALRSGGRGGGICCQASSNVTLTNCLITDNSAVVSGGVYCSGSSPTIVNCTITRNGATNGAGVGCVSDSFPAIRNSIMWNNVPMEIYRDSSSSPALSYCDVQTDYPGEGNFYGDPLFLDGDNANYHLSIGSPCIYAASSVGAPDKDIEGNPRPQGYGYDMGAYEMTGYDKTRPIIESFIANITEGYVPFEITFTCIAHDPDGEIVDYTIKYGDGSETETNSSGIFSHTYTSGGNVYVWCNVTDNAGITVHSTSMRIKAHGQIYVPSNYSTIQAAINAALDGDIVVVSDGTYTGVGNKNLDFKGKAITVRSENGPQNCIIDCEASGRGFDFHSTEGENSAVSGFTIKNGRMERAGGISCDNSSPVISNCIITGNTAYNANSGGIFLSKSSATITQCTITGNSSDMWGGGIGLFDSSPRILNSTISKNNSKYWWGGGIVSYNSKPYIINCLIAENSAPMQGGGLYSNNSSPVIANSDFIRNTSENGGGIYSCYSSNPVVTNSILWENSPNEIVVMSASIQVEHSLVKGDWEGKGNLDVNPKFVDPASDNYHLSDLSPCIGAGTLIGAPTTDIDGNQRPSPIGSYPDLGAYESPMAMRTAPTVDLFGMGVGNTWRYDGMYQGTSPYTLNKEVLRIDASSFPVSTYVVEEEIDGSTFGSWYQALPGELRLWGTQEGGSNDPLKFSGGLTVAWFPMAVANQRVTDATMVIQGYTFNVRMTVNVVAEEVVNLGFDSFSAYKARYELRVWNTSVGYDQTDAWYYWLAPYLGIIKYQDSALDENLSSFAIGEGTISRQSDADHDEIKDYRELIVYHTSWQSADTDNDGCSDGAEVQVGRDPLISDPQGDLNRDCVVNLTDAVMGLQSLLGLPGKENVAKEGDVNGDGKIGIAEVLYILQKTAGAR